MSFIAAFLAVIVLWVQSYGQIDVIVASNEDIKALAQQGIACGEAGGASSSWYRDINFLLMEQGELETCRGSFEDPTTTADTYTPFIPPGCEMDTDRYLVVGKAQNFKVPDSGTYTFHINANANVWLFINGKLIGGNHKDMYDSTAELFLCEGCDWGSCGLNSGIEFCKEECTGSIDLDQGNHEFKFWYWEGGGGKNNMRVDWTPPGGTRELIPVKVFMNPVSINGLPGITSGNKNPLQFEFNGMVLYPKITGPKKQVDTKGRLK